MFLNEGTIIAIITIMILTSSISKLKEKFPKLKWIPSGFSIALVLGLIVTFIMFNLGYINNKNEAIWDFLGSWIIVTGLAGYGHIAGIKLITIAKAFLSKNETQVAMAEMEIEQTKKKIEKLETKLKNFKEEK